MEFNFSQLKQKEVISVTDGKHLGKVCDLTLTFPENRFIGITVTGCKGFKFSRQEVFIPVKAIVKIGEDAILIKTDEKCKEPPCPPPCPPKRPDGNCPPPCPPDRRSYDEYE
ncbi:MAG: PRC-barrel domain-containing protein [Clostridia bacterium]|nr:PRC-barrel domain-containing protein [Clostridia bacterium]